MDEIWKWVAGYEGFYEVSNLGRVRSTGASRTNYRGKPRILRPSRGKWGYRHVVLYRNRSEKTCFVHRLVAIAFIPNPKRLPEVNHDDKKRSNNAASNLAWVTDADNKKHAKTFSDYGRVLRAKQVAQIKRRLEDGTNPRSLLAEFPGSLASMNAIRAGRIWKHVAAA